MKAKLQIKNFGPIVDLDIEISKFNILIGPHASGKSTISKVLCVIHSFEDYFSINYGSFLGQPLPDDFVSGINGREQVLKQLLSYYKIESFLNKNSYFFFEDDIFSFKLSESKINVQSKRKKGAKGFQSYYIPAERIALPMISESLFELTLEQSTLPRYFLQFGRDFTIARKEQDIFNLPILQLEFEYRNGRNFVILDNNESLLLEETSSAIQANLPLLVILQYPVKLASLFVIEELELHGFPSLQKALLSYIVERMKHPSLNDAYFVLPTHSPYILSAINNLIFAAKVGAQSKEMGSEVDKIIKKETWISKEGFSAFYIKDGKAFSILDEKTGLIDENELDMISEDLAGEFDALMDLYKPVNA